MPELTSSREQIDAYVRGSFPSTFPNGITEQTWNFHHENGPLDLHLDSLGTAWWFGIDLKSPHWVPQRNSALFGLIAWSFPKAKNRPLFSHVWREPFESGGFAGGFFSAHASTENLLPWWPWAKSWEKTLDQHEYFKERATDLHPQIVFVSTPEEAQTALAQRKKIAIFSVEGTHCLGPTWLTDRELRLQRLEFLKRDLGAAYITLNHYCSTDMSKSSTPAIGRKQSKGRLTTFGRKIVERANKLGLMIDLTHTATNCIIDVCEICKKNGVPAFVSHGSSLSVAKHLGGGRAGKHLKRNLEDEAIQAIVETGGCVGMIQVPYYLQSGYQADGKVNIDGSIDMLIDHYEGMKELIDGFGYEGWKHLAFGSDFDGGVAGLATEMRNAGDLPLLTQRMFDRGWKHSHITALYRENFLQAWQTASDAAA